MIGNQEEWRSIPDCENAYLVSSHGRVRSLKRSGKILPPRPGKRGYLRVSLRVDNKGSYRLVSRLVLMAFRGIPANGIEADHINKNTSDNRLTNLRWVSRAENQRHRISPRGEDNCNAKLTDEIVRDIRTMYDSGRYSQLGLAREFGVSGTAIRQAIKRISWQHVA